MKRVLAGLVGGLCLLGVPCGGAAQTSTGQVQVDAVVVSVALSLTLVRELAFGAVPQGVATTVAPTDTKAGEWQVTGNPDAFVTISMQLPSQLLNAEQGVTLPIQFDGGSARVRRATNDPHAAAPFDPNVVLTARLGPQPDAALYIWIGGTVDPAPTQMLGSYTGTIVISLAYL